MSRLAPTKSARVVADPNVTASMPSYTTLDLLVQYRTKFAGRDVTAQLDVRNLTDEEYREGNMGGWGDPRNFTFSLSTKF